MPESSLLRERNKPKPKKKPLPERAFEKLNLVRELKVLEVMLEELKIQYEQFFLGLLPHAPDHLHRDVKQAIRKIRKAPFKKSAIKYRQLTLEHRYQTYNDYWQRTQRKRDEGTYDRDLFKAELRERNAKEAALAGTTKGATARGVQELFQIYKQTLEKETGRAQRLDYDKFQKSIVKRAKALQQQHGSKKLSFKVVVDNGKVSIKARAKG